MIIRKMYIYLSIPVFLFIFAFRIDVRKSSRFLLAIFLLNFLSMVQVLKNINVRFKI